MNKQIEAVAKSMCIAHYNKHGLETVISRTDVQYANEHWVEWKVEAQAAIKAYQESAWIDISEAPKDGTAILGYDPEEGESDKYGVYIWTHYYKDEFKWREAGGEQYYVTDTLTHFQYIKPPTKIDEVKDD